MTTTRVSLPPAWAAAIREDALSILGPTLALERLRLHDNIILAHRVIIRVGRWYPNNPRHQSRTGQLQVVDYVNAAPYCEACGGRVTHGQHAIKYRWRRNGHGVGRIRYIHETCPGEDTP